MVKWVVNKKNIYFFFNLGIYVVVFNKKWHLVVFSLVLPQQWSTSEMVCSYTMTRTVKPPAVVSPELQRKLMQQTNDDKCFKGKTNVVHHRGARRSGSSACPLLAGWSWRDTGEWTTTAAPEENKGTECQTGNDKGVKRVACLLSERPTFWFHPSKIPRVNFSTALLFLLIFEDLFMHLQWQFPNLKNDVWREADKWHT